MKFLTIIFSILFFIPAYTFSQTYNAVSGNNGTSIYINSVVFNTINNSSGGGDDDGDGDAGYDFFSNTTTVTKGNTYTLTIDVVKQSKPEIYIKAWFDWNDDGDFTDAGEEYVLLTNSNQTSVSQSITIPATASSGNIRLRISYADGNPVTHSGNYNNGETEDYEITVISPAPQPEPSNHVTNFSATATGENDIDLSWTDASGGQLPIAYIIKANTTGSFTNPVDGTDPAEDTDLSDGSALVKVNYGVESYSFSSLNASTQYYFKIWPYTNTGSDIDFKTDGTIPTSNATTLSPPGPGDLFYYVSDSDDGLYLINRNTGSCSFIGSTGASNIEAIANWPANGNQILYAADAGNLGTINTSTGVFTVISDVDADGLANGSEGSQALSDIDGLAFDPRTGVLWASHRRSGTYDLLFKIDKSSGKFIKNAFGQGKDYIVIAGTGVYEDFDDMAVSPADGTLYGVSNNGTNDQILTINKTTGAINVVSTFSSVSDVEGLAFSNDNNMYGSTGANSDMGTNNDFLNIDWTTGNTTTVNSNMCGGGDVEALAALVEEANLIEGRVYHDANQNQNDDSESGLAGVIVKLYNDVNSNGQYDSGDEFLAQTTTDANGDYHFDYASTGDLVILINQSSLPSGYALTTDNIETASFASQSNTDSGNDFGADTGSDCDGNGIPDFVEGTNDTDGDGIPDNCDLDNDNDGILDSEEGIADLDGDGIPNYLDLDSDNDGIPDAIEANGGIAPTGYNSSTARITGSDSDNDGLLNSVDNAPSTAYGSSSTSTLPRGDNDGDGIKDFQDLDSDNDGILDIIEAGGTDSNGNGQVDGFTDSNNNGYHDAYESSPLPIPNTDGTWETMHSLKTLPNYLDLDSDNDGIDDTTEGYSTADLQYPSILTDSDNDGILDLWDNNTGGSPINPNDADADGTPDYIDTDSDNDGIPDSIEGNDSNNDYNPDISPSNTDNNENGIDDAIDNFCSGTTKITNTSSDYAEETNSDGSVYLTSSDLELVNDDYNGGHQTVGLLFSGLNVQQGQTISSAYIQFQTDEVSTGSVTFTIRAEDTDNAAIFSTSNYDISSRTTTTASVTWSPADWNTVGETGPNQKTVNIASVIQEVVNRAGWSSGNNIAIIITGPDNPTNYRIAENNPSLEINIAGGLSYACGTNIALQDYDGNGVKDWRDDNSGDDDPLPIELLSFEVKANKNIIEIIWTTASEINNDYFEVQKSKDGLNFETIETIDGAGNSNKIINYQTIDYNPYEGISYYRIKQTDFDGSFSFSEIKAVHFSQQINLKIYPNPASDILNIQSSSTGIIEIRNQNGSLVYKAEVQESTSKININELASGVYILRFISNENIEVMKFIKR
jgi:hypothetical protein